MSAAETRIAVRVTPRAGTDRVDRAEAGVLHVRVAAAPADGAANLAVVDLIASTLGIPRSQIRIVAAATGRLKLVAIAGVSLAAVAATWPALADRSGDAEGRASGRRPGGARSPRG